MMLNIVGVAITEPYNPDLTEEEILKRSKVTNETMNTRVYLSKSRHGSNGGGRGALRTSDPQRHRSNSASDVEELSYKSNITALLSRDGNRSSINYNSNFTDFSPNPMLNQYVDSRLQRTQSFGDKNQGLSIRNSSTNPRSFKSALLPSDKEQYNDSPIPSDHFFFNDDQDIAAVHFADEIPSPSTSMPSPFSKPPPKPPSNKKPRMSGVSSFW